jgi:two-component system, NtrC family, response regulator HydG
VSSDTDGFPEAPTVARSKLSPSELVGVSYALSVIEGPDAGRRFVVDAAQPSRTLIGKGPTCDVLLADPEISRRHAALEIVSRRLRITDLDSTNGTFVDGVAIGEAFLRGGEIVRMGSTAFRVDRATPEQVTPLSAVTRFSRMLGESPAMRRLYPLCQRLAQSNVPVVIEGETGTGKEQLAEALHEQGPRADKPFVILDCTAIAPSLIESELLGHERGAFTGAVGTRQGVFERAHTGTLLIDEIGDLPLELQPKLLRAIERSVVMRVGGDRAIQVDVRLLAATRRDLDREVQLGRFRDDLFHRIAVARIELPPLRDRAGDVRLLARHFWAELGGDPETLPGDLLLRWEDDRWPGNVRQLRNAVARRLALGDLEDSDTSATAVGVGPNSRRAAMSHGDSIARLLSLELPMVEARQKLVDEFEKRYIEHALEAHGGNVTRAAAAAGVTRRYLQRLKSKD